MNTFVITLPLVLLALLGFYVAKKHVISQQTIAELSKLTFNIFIPAFLFQRIATADLSASISASLLIVFYFSAISCFFFTLMGYRIIQRGRSNVLKDASVFALGASYSNTIIVGLPVLVLAFGDKVSATVFLVISFHSALLFALTSLLAIGGTKAKFNTLAFLRSTLYNPLLIAIFSGLAFNFAHINLPLWVNNSLMLIAEPAISLAILILGATLSTFKLGDNLKPSIISALIKLVLLPALVCLLSVFVFKLSYINTTILVILTACPTGVNAHLVANHHEVQQNVVASAVVVSTILSCISMPLWLLITKNIY